MRFCSAKRFGTQDSAASKRKCPQLQQRLTNEITDVIMEIIKPFGVAVVVEAEHLYMTIKNIKKPGSKAD